MQSCFMKLFKNIQEDVVFDTEKRLMTIVKVGIPARNIRELTWLANRQVIDIVAINADSEQLSAATKDVEHNAEMWCRTKASHKSMSSSVVSGTSTLLKTI